MGTPICVDTVTSKPAIERTFGHFARVLVDLDLTKELKHEVLVERKGFAFFVELEYENLPAFCDYCKLVGHNINVCRKANKPIIDLKNKGPVIEKDIVLRGKDVEKRPLGDQTQKKKWIHKENNVINLETEEVNRFDALQNEDAGNSQTVAHEDNTGKCAEKINVTQIASHASRDNRGPEGENSVEMPAENAVESEMDEDSSQASEFVDATQRLETESHSSSQEAPERIQNDMHFLNQSWAKLAETDETQILAQQEALNQALDAEADIDHQINLQVQNNIDSSGFQTVTRKSPKKKSHKALTNKVSASYLTRSKVPNRHFK